MSKAMVTVGVVIISVLTLLLVNIIQNYSSGNELDYSLLKDTTEAAMLDAVDLAYYQTSGGLVRMDKEKFVESFIRRFANSVNGDRYYDIRFYDINETPPKVSIKVGSSTTAVFAGENFDIKNSISAILESTYNNRDDSEKLLDTINSNSKNKPASYPSYTNNFDPSSGGNYDDDDDVFIDDDEWMPTEENVTKMYTNHMVSFYGSDRRKLPIADFQEKMIELFSEERSLNQAETEMIKDLCEKIYNSKVRPSLNVQTISGGITILN